MTLAKIMTKFGLSKWLCFFTNVSSILYHSHVSRTKHLILRAVQPRAAVNIKANPSHYRSVEALRVSDVETP